jgi:hypothetical protein
MRCSYASRLEVLRSGGGFDGGWPLSKQLDAQDQSYTARHKTGTKEGLIGIAQAI